VAKINVEREITEKDAEKKKRFIDDEIVLHQLKGHGDAEYYRVVHLAQANKFLFTEKYLRFILYKSLANNTSIYFGGKIPTMFWGGALHPNLNPKSEPIGNVTYFQSQ